MRRLLLSVAAICLLALAAVALARRPPQAPGDDIIIKGGSMSIQCGTNHGKDCFSHTTGTYLYTHKKATAHITHVSVKDSAGNELCTNCDFAPAAQPTITVTFK